jgi:hypothetical protein
MQMVDSFKRRIPRLPPVLALTVLGFGSEEPQVLFKDVLDAEEDVAEAGLPHQPGEPLAAVGDGRGHRLDGVLEVVQPGVNNRPAERLEPPHVKRDVVVHDDERPGAMVSCVAGCPPRPAPRSRCGSCVRAFR